MCHLLGIHLNFEDDLMDFKDQTLLMKEYPSDANLSTSKLSQELLLDWLDDNILDNTMTSICLTQTTMPLLIQIPSINPMTTSQWVVDTIPKQLRSHPTILNL